MVCVAIAGGTGGLGRVIVAALAKSGQHNVVLLTRKQTSMFDDLPQVKCLVTTYGDEKALRDMFESHKVHTVISVLGPPFPESFETEKILIAAATASQTVKRFIPSQFAIDYEVDDDHLPVDWKIYKNQTTTLLRQQSHLEYTLVYVGHFMDYFSTDCHLIPEVPFVDIAAGKASVPGDGNAKVTFTHTGDVGRAAVKLVGLEVGEWKEKSIVVGDKASFNDIVGMAENARGIKFDVTHDSLSDLRNGKVTEIPAWVPLYKMFSKEFFDGIFSAFGLNMALGCQDFEEEGSLSERFPEVITVKLADVIERSWGGK